MHEALNLLCYLCGPVDTKLGKFPPQQGEQHVHATNIHYCDVELRCVLCASTEV
jgi:hypothetical protein